MAKLIWGGKLSSVTVRYKRVYKSKKNNVIFMFWYTDKMGTCGQMEAKEALAMKDDSIEVIIVYDLIDGYQENWGQFKSKVKAVEKALAKGKKVIVACRGGMSRSNSVVLAYLLKSGMDWGEAYNLIRTNPMAMIEPNLLNQVKKSYGGDKYDNINRDK